MVYKVDGNPQLDRCDWSMYSNILKACDLEIINIQEAQKAVQSSGKAGYVYIYISSSILKKESKLTFENVPTMSWIQSTEISGELSFSLL